MPLASHAERDCQDGHLMMRTLRSASRVLVCFVIVTPTAHMIPNSFLLSPLVSSRIAD